MAADYEKNLFNHNQALTKENERLRVRLAKIETETANKYLEIIDSLNKNLEDVLAKCGELEKRIEKLANSTL